MLNPLFDKVRDFFKKDEDFSERLKDSKNPFLGTLSLIWVIRNWQIVYAIFFDDRAFEVRLFFIKSRISAISFWEILGQFVINVLLTLLAIVVIYLLVYFTRFITNKFENKLLPWIYSKSAKGEIRLKKDFDRIESEKENLSKRLKSEKERRIEAEGEIQSLEEELREKSLKETTSKVKSVKEDIHNQEEKSNTNIKPEKKHSEIDLLMSKYDKIAKNFSDQEVEKIFKASLLGMRVEAEKYEDLLGELIRIGFLEAGKLDSDGWAHYSLTSIGKEVLSELE